MTTSEPATWTPETTDRLVALHRAGKTYAEISAALNVSRHAVRSKLVRLGLIVGAAPRPPRAYVERRSKTTTNDIGKDWDQKLTLPYALWKQWNRQRRAGA